MNAAKKTGSLYIIENGNLEEIEGNIIFSGTLLRPEFDGENIAKNLYWYLLLTLREQINNNKAEAKDTYFHINENLPNRCNQNSASIGSKCIFQDEQSYRSSVGVSVDPITMHKVSDQMTREEDNQGYSNHEMKNSNNHAGMSQTKQFNMNLNDNIQANAGTEKAICRQWKICSSDSTQNTNISQDGHFFTSRSLNNDPIEPTFAKRTPFGSPIENYPSV